MFNQGNIGHTAVETSMDFLLSAEVERATTFAIAILSLSSAFLVTQLYDCSVKKHYFNTFNVG